MCTGESATLTAHVATNAALDGDYILTVRATGAGSPGEASGVAMLHVSSDLKPDLAIDSISVAPTTVPIPEHDPITISTVIRNAGLANALAYKVKFFEGLNFLGEVVEASIPTNTTQTVELTLPAGLSEGFYAIRAEALLTDGVESNVKNNARSTFIQIGTPIDIGDAYIDIVGSGSLSCDNSLVTFHGSMNYVVVTSTGSATFPLQGGIVQVDVLDASGTNTLGTGQSHTLTPGTFSLSLPTAGPGTYVVGISGTDGVLAGQIFIPLVVGATSNCIQGGIPEFE